jgi:hypothetical protein
MQQMVLAAIILGMGMAGCGRPADAVDQAPGEATAEVSEENLSSERIRQIRERVPEMPIIVLVKQPDLSSHVLDVQDYVVDGESVVPMFSSRATLTQSLAGADLGRPTFAIARPLLGQMLKGNEVFLLDPRLPAQLRFTAAEYREAFPEPFNSLTTKSAN